MNANPVIAMNPTRTCDCCGTAVPASAPQGLCLRCLLDTAMAPDAEGAGTRLAPSPRPTSVAPGTPPPTFGDYELLGELGRGGQGVVHRARHRGLGRIVALKTVPPAHVAGAHARERFHLEASAAARLDHPNIVPIYEVGECDGFCFYSMKLVEGANLGELFARGLSDAEAGRQLAAILIKAANAVHHAHQRGVLHRDLKPSNLLLDRENEPHVTDFGLARLAGEDSSLTASQALIGTPAFLAPEVAARGARQATVAADIYGLGAILYQLLTGKPPFAGPTVAETMRAAQEDEPVRPRATYPSVPLDLETICLKCLEKDPARRYATAQQLAEELERFLNGEPIQARPIGPTARMWRRCRRRPALASALGLGALLVLVVGIGAPIAAYRIDSERKSAIAERRRAEAGERTARQKQYVADMNLALQAWEKGNLRRALGLLTNHVPKPGQSDLRGFDWRYLWNLCQDVSRSTVPLPADDPVRERVSTHAHGFLALACENTVRLLDLASGRELDQFAYPTPGKRDVRPLIALASGNTNLLAVHRAGGVVSLRDLAKKTWLQSFRPFVKDAATIALSPDGRWLGAAAGTNLVVWDISTGSAAPARELWARESESDCSKLRFSPDGQTLIADATYSHDGYLVAWRVQTGQKLAGFPRPPGGSIWTMNFSSDGSLLAYSGVSTRITVLDFARRTVKWSLDGHLGIVTSLAFSADGGRLLSSGLDGTIRQWDLGTGLQAGLWRDPHDNGVWWAGYAPGGQSLLSLNAGEVKTWSAEEQSAAAIIDNEQEMGGPAPAVSPDGKWLVTTDSRNASTTERAKVWELATGKLKLYLAHAELEVRGPAFSPDGKLFALGSQGRTIGLWETAAWERTDGRALPFAYLTNDFEPGALAFSPDGTVLAAAGMVAIPGNPSGATNRLAFWEAGSWRKLDLLSGAGAVLDEHAAAATVAFSRDGRWLALGLRDGWARLWDFPARRLVKEFRVYPSKPRLYSVLGVLVAFSRDGRWLAASSQGDRNVALLDLADPKQAPRTLATDTHYRIWSLAFAPDSKSVATGGNDGLVRLWNLETLEVALALRHGPGHSLFIAFAPDGNLLVSQDSQGQLKLWPATPAAEISRLETAARSEDSK